MPKRHPFESTLGLLELSLKHLPPTFPETRRQDFTERLTFFREHPEIDYDSISKTIVELGKESWPHRMAYSDLYAAYGRASEEAYLLENLDRGVREKYEQFLHEGGKINYLDRVKSLDDLKRPSPFENYFTPEEKFAVEQALLAARDAARQEINGLVTGAKSEEYGRLVLEYGELQKRLETMIDELRGLAAVSEKWRPQILDKVRVYEEGWSVVEKPVSEDRLGRTLEFWRGTLAQFLQA